jgi:hypothetical protein
MSDVRNNEELEEFLKKEIRRRWFEILDAQIAEFEAKLPFTSIEQSVKDFCEELKKQNGDKKNP